MKFGKELVSQMVPEWQDAYMNYHHLKSLLKDIKSHTDRDRNSNRASTPRTPSKLTTSALKRKESAYRALNVLTRRRSSAVPEEEQVILVNMVPLGEDQNSETSKYETTFLMSSEEGGEYELLFFDALDEEFNKALNFYKSKVEEVQKEAKKLNKQVDALVAFRVQVHNPSLRFEFAAAEEDEAEALTPSSKVNNTRTSGSGMAHMEVINEELSSEGYPQGMDKGSNEAKSSNQKNAGGKRNSRRPTPLQVLEHFKINVTDETPWSILKSVLVGSDHELTFSREELRKIEEQLERAFIEFHQKLRSIKSYCFMNILAFSKIMKKYDKVTSRSASKSYLKMMDNSYLGSSDEVSRLMERVEAAFIKHFSNGNRRKGMNTLRPKAIKGKHRVSFFWGFLSGCTIALIAAIVVLIHIRDILNSEGRFQYMENIFPLYSLFGFIVLHLLMYGANIYFWRHYHVNYPFIFGFNQGTDIGYREVFLLSTGLAVLSLTGVLSNLEMEMEQNMKSFNASRELVPLGLLIVLLILTFCPFNIIYRSTRYFFLQCVLRCILAPLYKVTLADFFLADQFTSQVQAIRSLEFYICYYGWGDFKRRSHDCQHSDVYKAFYIIVAVIPYWIRLLQCCSASAACSKRKMYIRHIME
ncbi:phosphate transporter PHO1 homolog 3-like isoform X2 [Macadamia integrifolia]|uniref:phosphate transporter PHO1 homolog 3-like isoform X2 n=1 Tax=Macadamia integrifolia TaxID=60698 RepID=UPI001C4F7563|nr:phosphate transporter PHO1 homolog 3-like isoform X2 [Macadamia integrifolia]